MSELSMHEMEAELGEVLPEREALSAIAFGRGSHATQVTHVTNVNANDFSNATAVGFGSTAISSAHQTVVVNG
jgi:hypothetical protein